MKTSTKVLIGLGLVAGVTAALAVGIIRELKAIRALTIDADDLAEDLGEDIDGVIIAE